MYNLLIFRELLRGHLMYPGKGSIQEVMGLPPRSVTKCRNPNQMRPLPVAFLKCLSQSSQVEAHGKMWPADVFCLACMVFFYNLDINALGAGGRGEQYSLKLKAPAPSASFPPLRLPPWPLKASVSHPTVPLHSPVFRLRAKYTVLFLMQGKQALNLCLYQVIHKGTTKLPCAQIDSLMSMLAWAYLHIAACLREEASYKWNNRRHLHWGRWGAEEMANILWNSHSAHSKTSVLQLDEFLFFNWITMRFKGKQLKWTWQLPSPEGTLTNQCWFSLVKTQRFGFRHQHVSLESLLILYFSMYLS